MKYFLVLAMIFVYSCAKQMKVQQPIMKEKKLLKEAKSYFKPINSSAISKKKWKNRIALGEKLYFEKKLSVNNTISCNSCHKLDQFGVDNEATSPGHDGTRGDRNSPTVYNAALNFRQFWDGRAKDLAAQAIGPILNPIEHGLASEKDAMAKIDNKEYRKLFKKAGLGFTYKNIGKAIGAFEKTLLTPSRFDDYLRGKVDALSSTEKRGLEVFMETGCTSCHDGAGIGGGSYQKLGAINEYATHDKGRFNVTKDEEDMYFFKVPLLRNITKTGPYLHDGSIDDLEEMVKIMAKHQLDVELKQDDVDAIISFLGSLEAKPNYLYKMKK
jgi:cytochrome c peroxidase